MNSPIVKRSVILDKHKTSVSLEAEFWEGLKEIAQLRELPVAHLVAEIDKSRDNGNLSSAIRLFVLDYYQRQTAAK